MIIMQLACNKWLSSAMCVVGGDGKSCLQHAPHGVAELIAPCMPCTK